MQPASLHEASTSFWAITTNYALRVESSTVANTFNLIL